MPYFPKMSNFHFWEIAIRIRRAAYRIAIAAHPKTDVKTCGSHVSHTVRFARLSYREARMSLASPYAPPPHACRAPFHTP